MYTPKRYFIGKNANHHLTMQLPQIFNLLKNKQTVFVKCNKMRHACIKPSLKIHNVLLKKRNYLGIQWLRLGAFTVKGLGLIPG